MKPNFSRRNSFRSGFTLVELLVVIGIIAILAAATLAGVSAAINSAKRAKCANMANQIQTAVINYDTEYSTYPISSGDTGTDVYFAKTDTVRWNTLTQVLCGNINPLTPTAAVANVDGLNSRNIPFFSPSRSDLSTTAGAVFPKNPFTTATKPDAYYMALDGDYSGVVGDSAPAKGTLPDFVGSQGKSTLSFLPGGVTQGVAVWSNSQDTPYPGTAVHPQFWAHTY